MPNGGLECEIKGFTTSTANDERWIVSEEYAIPLAGDVRLTTISAQHRLPNGDRRFKVDAVE